MNALNEACVQIVMPYRGREDYFKETVLSVLAQTHQNWLLTIFDNASDSKTASIWVEKLEDSRIQYLRFENQVSLIQNFSRAVDSLEAEWGMILGADDILEKNFLHAAIATTVKYPYVSAVLPKVISINSQGNIAWAMIDRINQIFRPLNSEGVFNNHKAKASLCVTNWMYITSMIVRKEMFQEFPFKVGLDNTFDLDFFISLFKNGKKVAFSPEAVFFYRRHPETASLNTTFALARAKEEQKIFRELHIDFQRQHLMFLSILAHLRIGYRSYVLIRALTAGPGVRLSLLKIAFGR